MSIVGGVRKNPGLRRRLVRGFVCLALLYHLVGVTFANLPRDTALGSNVHAWLSPYTSYLGLWQDWAMFTTIPYFESLVPVLEATTAPQQTLDYGPILPELNAAPQSLRVTSLFGRMVWSRPAYSKQIARYEQLACRSVQSRSGTTPVSIRVRLDGQRLHRLDSVRSTGVSSHPQQASSRVFTCPTTTTSHPARVDDRQ